MKKQCYAVSFFCKGEGVSGGIIKLVKARTESQAYEKVVKYLTKHGIIVVGDMQVDCEVV